MGFKEALSAVLGTTRLPAAKLDTLFAISAAAVTMQARFDLRPSHAAGICFKPIESSRYDATRTEIEELLQYSARETASTFRILTDEFRFTWVILGDPDFEDLITGVHLVSQTMIERGLGAYLLCAVFGFEKEKPVYWIYNFKQGNYYPFVPIADRARDSAMEFRVRSLMDRELPVEKDVGKWYPLWGIPF